MYINNLGQVRLGVRPWVDSGIDSSANLFFAASGLSDTTQRNAVNTLVKDLKRFGLWNKIKAFYPFVGGTADSHKWNLVDPRDTNSAYRLQFSGGWTHTSMGVKTNGSNTSANTFLSLRSTFGSTSTKHTLGIYINENPSSLISYRNDITASDGSATSTSNIAQVTIPSTTHIVDMTTNWWSWIFTPKDVTGLTEFKRYNEKYTCAFVNGYEIQDWRNTTVSPYYNPISSITIGSSGSTNRYCTAYICDALDSFDSYLMYLAVQKFNTSLYRNTGSGVVGITSGTYSSTQTLVTTGLTINLDSSNVTRPQEVLLRNTSLTDPGTYFMKNDIWPDSSGNGNNGTFQRNDNNNRSCGYFTSDDLNIPEIRFHDQSTSPAAKLYGNNSDWVDTPYIGSDSGTYTFGGWVKTTSVFSSSSIFCRGRDGNGNGWGMMMSVSSGSKLGFSVIPTSGTITGITPAAQLNISGSTTLFSNNWYNVYVVWKPNNFVKLYVNGVLDASFTMTVPSVRSSTVGWTLNKANNSTTNGNIIVGAFHVYDRDLSSTEILQNFNAQRSKYNIASADDSDAQAFVVAAGLTNRTQITAVNTLVTALKTAGIWTKMKAIYPFVGGTAYSHKFNLKDPRDADAAFRLTFSGGMTHSSTGVLFGGANGYADTFFRPGSNYDNTTWNAHMSFYSRSNVEAPTTNWLSGGFGVDSDYASGAYFVLIVNRKGTRTIDGRLIGTQWASYTSALDDSRGLFMINKQSEALLKLTKNTTLLAQNTTSSWSINKPGDKLYLGAVNGSQSYSGLNYDNKEYAFATIGSGLTDAEATAFYNAVQAYQTALGRAV